MITPEQARAYYGDNDSAHDFDHVLRVTRIAERLALEEGADLEVVRTAALLHDIARAEQERTGISHAELGAQAARRILCGFPEDRVEAVTSAIRQHRFRGSDPPTSIEARVLYDADKLDAIGAVGVARAYLYGGQQHQRLWASVESADAALDVSVAEAGVAAGQYTAVHEYMFKLAKLCDVMLTESGRRMARGRHRFMVQFFERLEREVSGEL
ncbi:MAG: HD domain-containing protein [Chloroflexi bacterium]|nr:HD domain-containing protein [Chloroflexota bacterium]